jgi:glycosyltransferase involved in cell wall biosynthesis
VIPIKVVILTPFYPPIKGGITTFVVNLQKHLKNKDISVSIITRKGKMDDNVQVLGPNKYISVLKTLLILRKMKPDVLHSHSHWSLMFPCLWYKRFHPSTKLIHTIHTEPVKQPSGFKKKIYERLFSKYDIITFVSDDLKKKYESIFQFQTEKIVIYSGVSVDKASEGEIKEFLNQYNLKDRFPILSFCGPLSWQLKVEGVKRLIAALKILKIDYPDAKLLIVGDGEYRKELEEFYGRYNLAKDVIITGFLDKPSIPLSASHIYTHISLQEGLPIALLEAMCLGKPIIASKTGGIPEIIVDGKSGILVDPKSEEIAGQIGELIKNKEKMEILGKNAQLRVKKEHKWEIVTQRFIKLYANEN